MYVQTIRRQRGSDIWDMKGCSEGKAIFELLGNIVAHSNTTSYLANMRKLKIFIVSYCAILRSKTMN